MTKYLALSLVFLAGCSAPPAPSPVVAHYLCITALGPAQVDSNDPEAKILKRSLVVKSNDGKTIEIPKSLCVVVTE